MDSKCPKCKKMITHEDFLFEVQCECGSRFNPFMGLESSDNALDTGDSGPDSFKESKSAFEDIQQFGETMPEAIPEPKSTSGGMEQLETSGGGNSMGVPELDTSSPLTANDGGFIFSSAPHLDGYRTEAYLMPVSVQANIDTSAQDPLKEAFLLLKKRAESQGANAIVGFQWKVASDGSRVFVSGLPLKVKRGS